MRVRPYGISCALGPPSKSRETTTPPVTGICECWGTFRGFLSHCLLLDCTDAAKDSSNRQADRSHLKSQNKNLPQPHPTSDGSEPTEVPPTVLGLSLSRVAQEVTGVFAGNPDGRLSLTLPCVVVLQLKCPDFSPMSFASMVYKFLVSKGSAPKCAWARSFISWTSRKGGKLSIGKNPRRPTLPTGVT